MTRVLCVGECMLELRRANATSLQLGYAGDTYNTAVYLRRVATELGAPVEVGYLTGLGDDEDSREMRAAWAADGIADRALRVPGKTPGLYIVRTDEAGERSFSYWRSDSAARALFSGVDWLAALDGDVIHLSGITLQLMSLASLEALMDRLDALRGAGARIALDTNYRPAGWTSATVARAALDAAARRAHTVFASLEDAVLLGAGGEPERVVERLVALGADEVVVKDGPRGAWLAAGDDVVHLPAVPPQRIADTTAAGDALAGAHLAARIAGRAPGEALALAMGVAAVAIAHPGALAPRETPLTTVPAG